MTPDQTTTSVSASGLPEAEPVHLLLAGGTGFFGRSILRFLLAGHPPARLKIDILTRDPDRFVDQHPYLAQHNWLRFVRGDVMRPETLPASADYTHILHAAADSTLGPTLPPLVRHDQIVTGTRNLLDYAVKIRARRFLLTSSGVVYGQPANAPGASDHWREMLDPLSVAHTHTHAKREAEHLCALYRDACGLETIVARCFSFVGPDLPLDVHFAIGNFIRDALYGDEIVVLGDGAAVRSYLYQDDLAHWLLQLLLRGQAGTAYDVGSDQPVSIADLAQTVRDCLAPGKPIRILGRNEGYRHADYYVPDISRARNELGLDVSVPLTAAIRKTAERFGSVFQAVIA
jgi:UDP-glucuronate decarboxylase